MNRFRNGQKVVCTNSAPWYTERRNWLGMRKKVPGPKKGEIVTVIRYDFDRPGYMYIQPYEMYGNYIDLPFEPLQSDVIVKEIQIAEPSLN